MSANYDRATGAVPLAEQKRVGELTRYQVQLRQVGLVAGGQYGSLLARLFGLAVSGSSLLRRTQQTARPRTLTPLVLGVDDWAFKKRERYGAILVGLEKRQVINLLPDQETNTLEAWLEDHPGIDVSSRDRAGPRWRVPMRFATIGDG